MKKSSTVQLGRDAFNGSIEPVVKEESRRQDRILLRKQGGPRT